MAVWAGIDVGAQRKGFHVAAVNDRRVVYGPINVISVADAVDMFPTASWTRLHGPRGSLARGAWSSAALHSLHLEGVRTRRLGQDDRDAIGAAWTARLCSQPGAIEWFGEIAVPV